MDRNTTRLTSGAVAMRDAGLKRYLRVRDIIAPGGILPIARSTWWAGVKTGRFPKPLKLGLRVSLWHAADIDRLLAEAESDQN